MSQAEPVRKLRVVRALVRPDRRADYLARWTTYADAVRGLGGRAWLFEDEVLPGRFLEFTEYEAGEGMEAGLASAHDAAGLARACVRRTGWEERYREVRPS